MQQAWKDGEGKRGEVLSDAARSCRSLAEEAERIAVRLRDLVSIDR